MIRRIIPLILSYIVLGAHFLRYGNLPVVLICLLIPFALFIKKRWVLRSVQILTVLGGLFWLKVAADILMVRMLTGESWGRMVAILATVALFTLWSAWLIGRPAVAEKYS